MTNRLILALIFLQVVSLGYLILGGKAPINLPQANNSDMEKLENNVHVLQTEIRELKHMLRQQSNGTSAGAMIESGDEVARRENRTEENKHKPLEYDFLMRPDTEDVVNKSSTIVSDAISRTQWKKEDSIALMQLVPALSREQKTVLLNQIADAVNRQELKLDAPLPPM